MIDIGAARSPSPPPGGAAVLTALDRVRAARPHSVGVGDGARLARRVGARVERALHTLVARPCVVIVADSAA